MAPLCSCGLRGGGCAGERGFRTCLDSFCLPARSPWPCVCLVTTAGCWCSGRLEPGLGQRRHQQSPGAAPCSSRWCRWKQRLSHCLGKQTRLTQPRRGCSACLPEPVPRQGTKHPDLPFTLPPVPFPARFLEVTRVGSAKSFQPSPGLPGCSGPRAPAGPRARPQPWDHRTRPAPGVRAAPRRGRGLPGVGQSLD